jgi:glucose/mannose transport system substrate-binding protein
MRRLMLGVTAIVVLGLAACGGDDTEEQREVEIFSWWVSGGEVEALDALIALHESLHPDVTVRNLAAEYADQARDELKNRMAAGTPPDTFQANIGYGVLTWAPEALESLDDLAADQGWTTAFEPAVLAAASEGGVLYAVPMNIHRINSLFYNSKVLADHGLTPATTLEELHDQCLTLRAAGVTPIALGNINNWTLQELAFECVLPAVAGADGYETYWRGDSTADSQEMQDTLAYVLSLFADDCFNTDSTTIDWTAALDMVADNTAAYSEMGDWAKGYLESVGQIADDDFGVVPFPGTSDIFVYTSDTFPLPKGAAHRDDAIDLLITMASIDGQIAFNQIKGSIPARVDIDAAASFDSMQQATYASWKTGTTKALAMSGLVKPDVMTDLGVRLKDAMSIGDTSQLMNYLVNNYASLK